jgi:hypothetical protein
MTGYDPYDTEMIGPLTREQAEEEAYWQAQADAEREQYVAAYGQEAWDAEERHYQEQAEAEANCLVAAFHNDPITRSAGLDADEERPIVDAARQECAERGCPLCNETAGCYVCHGEAGGSVMEQDQAKLPQRRIVSERTVNPADPTTMLTLACGHSII